MARPRPISISISLCIPWLAGGCFSPTDLDDGGATSGTGATSGASASSSAGPTTEDTALTELTGPTFPMDSSGAPDTTAASDATTSSAASCGDGLPDDGEECDDGNTNVGDGCSAACLDEGITCDTALVGALSPFQVGRMVADGGYVYGVPGPNTSADGILRIYDVNDPAAPSPLSTFTVDPLDYPNWRARGIAKGGDHVWIAGGGPEFLSIDVTDPAVPLLGDLDGPNEIDGPIAIEGDLMLTAESVGDEARLYDISDPNSAMQVALLGTGVEYDVALHDTWAILWGNTGLELYDISVVGAPVLTGLVAPFPGPTERIVANDDSIFVAAQGGLVAVDYSQPDFPQIVDGDYGPLASYTDLALREHFLYLPVANGVNVYDVTDPAEPIQAGTYLQIDAYPTAIAIDPPYLYLSTENGLRIVEDLPGLCDARCGNAFVEYPEQCDDGNLDPDDGCNACVEG